MPRRAPKIRFTSANKPDPDVVWSIWGEEIMRRIHKMVEEERASATGKGPKSTTDADNMKTDD